MQLRVMVEKRALFFLKRKKEVVTTEKAVTSFTSHVRMGYSKFVNREAMLKQAVRRGKAAGDPFTIRCSIVVHNGSRAVEGEKSSKAAASIVPAPPSNLSAHLGELLSSKRGTDVVFDVGGETFAAHRAVLAARSPVFAVELFSAVMRESDGGAGVVVRVDDMEPQVFQTLLRLAAPGDDEDETGGSRRHVAAPSCRGGQVRHGEAQEDV
jgi:speckle-type POZ protein